MEPIHTEIELKKLVLNTGQIEGLPANPRKIDVNAFSKLKENITNNPEMLALRGLIVYETEGGKYVVIGGNMRLRAMRELGTFDKAPCIIVPPGTPRGEAQDLHRPRQPAGGRLGLGNGHRVDDLSADGNVVRRVVYKTMTDLLDSEDEIIAL